MLLGRNNLASVRWVYFVVYCWMCLGVNGWVCLGVYGWVCLGVYRWVCFGVYRWVCLLVPLMADLVRDEVLDVNKPVAGGDKWRRSCAIPKAVHDEPGLADPHCKPGEVAIARYQAKGVETASVQQIHGVDNHGGVRRILAMRIGELLHRLDGLLEELTLPPIQESAGPVAIGPLYAYGPISSDLRE